MDRLIDFIKKYKYSVIGGVCALVALAVVIIIASGSGGEDGQSVADWGEGITEDIPEFSSEYSSHTGGEGYAAFYYENVTGEQVQIYTAQLESELNIKFSSTKYPRSAIYGEKIIAIHYNVTEMKMSVTVTQNSTESTQSGEQQ